MSAAQRSWRGGQEPDDAADDVPRRSMTVSIRSTGPPSQNRSRNLLPTSSTCAPNKKRPAPAPAPAPALPESSLFVPQAESRALSGYDGNLEAPPTVCFEQLHHKPFYHVLVCGHTVKTPTIRECAGNCKLADHAESKVHGYYIRCNAAKCVVRRDGASIFLPRKNRRPLPRRCKPSDVNSAARNKKRPADAEMVELQDDHDMPQPSKKRTKLALPGDHSFAEPRPRHPMQSPAPVMDKDNRATAQHNMAMAQDPALKNLAEAAAGPGVREWSVQHGGFAYQQELQTKTNATKLHRALKPLDIDGKDSLKYNLPRGATVAEDGSFSLPDKPHGAPDQREMPNSYGRGSRSDRKSIRNQHAGMFSMSQTLHDQMREDESGVTIDREDPFANAHPRSKFDAGDADGDDEMTGMEANGGIQADGTYHEAESHCVCQSAFDESLAECDGCNKWFHPEYIGKDPVESDDDAGPDGRSSRKRRQDHSSGQYTCDLCHEKIYLIRYVCLDCRGLDYCSDCAKSAKSFHHPSHSFEAVLPSGEVQSAKIKPPFSCLDCDRQAGVVKPNETKTLSIADIRAINAKHRQKRDAEAAVYDTKLIVEKRKQLAQAKTPEARKLVLEKYEQLGLGNVDLDSPSSGKEGATPQKRAKRGRVGAMTAMTTLEEGPEQIEIDEPSKIMSMKPSVGDQSRSREQACSRQNAVQPGD